MSSLLERLEQREAAARGRVEELRAELDGLAERLAAGRGAAVSAGDHQADGAGAPGR
jgi:hypothetical protein